MLEVTSLTMGLPKAWSRVNKHIRIRAAYRFVNIDMISICLKKYRYTDTIVRTGAYRKGHNSSTKFQNGVLVSRFVNITVLYWKHFKWKCWFKFKDYVVSTSFIYSKIANIIYFLKMYKPINSSEYKLFCII